MWRYPYLCKNDGDIKLAGKR
uniref:Uncharacterized protein n=1 Tax=Anguilla anguilla TaxID=7936 RepID=A0A0E9QR98_ANGAN